MRWRIPFGRKAKTNRRKPPWAAREQVARPGSRVGRMLLAWPVLLLLLLLATVCALSIMYRRTPMTLHYMLGQVADRYVYSAVRFQYMDTAQTAKRREQAALRVPPVYRRNPLVAESAILVVNELWPALDGLMPPVIEGQPAPIHNSRAEELVSQLDAAERSLLADALRDEERRLFLREQVETVLHGGVADPEDLAELMETGGDTARVQIMSDESGTVRSSPTMVRDLRAPAQAIAQVRDRFLERYPAPGDAGRPPLDKLLDAILQVNLAYHSKATQTARQRAIDTVEPVVATVPANEVLLRPGQVVGEEDLAMLASHLRAQYQQQQGQRLALDWVVTLLLSLVLVGGGGLCLASALPRVVADRSMLGALVLGVCLQMVLTRATVNLYFLWLGSSPFVFAALPLAFAAMLLTPLVGPAAAIWAGLLGAVVAGLQNSPGDAFRIFLVGLAATLAGTYMTRDVRKRSQIYRAGLAVGLATFLVELLLAFRVEYAGAAVSRVFLLLFVHAMVNGLVLAIAISALLPLFEYVFGLLTDITLLELTDLNHPVLRQLQMEAPGTYHHCISVAILVEQAAEAIGANALLARVCAYFHDIGKLAKPAYFTENNRGENPHDELNPRMSSLVILNHVKEGMDLARQFKLKKPIREAIEQHHGTTLVSYFYEKAKAPGGETPEGDYRYPGPRPIRREIAILSIADCCEAAARSLSRPTPQRLEALIDQLVFARVRDHQLDNAELTFAELTAVRRSMVRTLTGMLHTRIAYPGTADKEKEKEKEKDEAASVKTLPPPPPEEPSDSPDDAAPGGKA